MKDYFFQVTGYQKKHGFDSYSKEAKDIIDFYYKKYPEVSKKFKNAEPLTKFEIASIIQNNENESNSNIGSSELSKLNSAFEKYIIAFIWAMKDEHVNAEKYFLSCYDMLDNSFSSEVNKIFILLQLAQIYERMKEYNRALKTLLDVHKTIYHNKVLISEISNFYASCCVSIGLLFNRFYHRKHISGFLFSKSISLRIKYKNNYPPLVFENYISIAYRYIALTYYDKSTDQYIYLKNSYVIRSQILESTNDEFTKKEFSYLSVDFINFLISNNYNVGYVNKISNKFYKIIILLNSESKHEMANHLAKSCLVIAKYYFVKNEFFKFYKWYTLVKHLKYVYSINIEERFLSSEDVYEIMKN